MFGYMNACPAGNILTQTQMLYMDRYCLDTHSYSNLTILKEIL